MAIGISVIVACKNEQRDIPKCINALLCQTFPKGRFEMVFVDGGSTDGTLGIIGKYAKRARNIMLVNESGKPKSAGHARNQGAKLSRGGILVFFDADAVPTKGYLAEISRMPKPALAASSNVRPFPSKSIWAALRECETLASNYLIESGHGTQFPNIFRKKFFLEMGGYEAKYRYGEDLRLLEKMKGEGANPINLPRAVIFHRDPDSLGEIAAQSRFWGSGFYALFMSDPGRHFPRLALVAARALWLPLYLAYLAFPLNLLLFLAGGVFLASVADAAIQLYRSTRMGAKFRNAILIMPFRMIRSLYFLQGFLMAMLAR
ncbi:MAG TPA: glycosyltransferase [Candidatus Norongarragalinales archaeon]|nr:glycosyltransferase [Candidatus Norongarragalinales archaeon]